VSGSGKSTLAFDLLFAEGQRRFLDSMSAYARQFVEQLARPEVDLIDGIPPTVSIEQRNSRGGGKSTVATVTEIYHFVRLLFARLGTQFSPQCDIPVEAQTRDQLGRRLQAAIRTKGPLVILAPVVKNRKGFHTEVAEWAAKHGYAQLRADGKLRPTSEQLRLDRFREHNVEIVVGRLHKNGSTGGTKSAQQLIDEALVLGNGTLLAWAEDGTTVVHSTERACPDCGRSFRPLDPKDFSYNSAQGWCPRCRGFGELFYLPDVDRGARADAIEESWFGWQEGSREPCPDCHGARLNPEARAVRLVAGGAAEAAAFLGRRTSPRPARRSRGQERTAPTVDSIGNAAVDEALAFFGSLRFTGREAAIARDILPEIVERLQFLAEVGLGYLQLGRSATTLSGGEAQRIRLAAQLGSNLSGVLYVLDEPTIGLHARDNEQLLRALTLLRERGNSLIVVEHDEATMRHADYIIDLGPGAGVNGGAVVAGGTLQELMRHKDSITGQCLRTHRRYPSRGSRRPVGKLSSAACAPRNSARAGRHTAALVLKNAAVNNLKSLNVAFPLNRLVVVTGVSGSGKSTLVRECLLPALEPHLKRHSRISAPTSGCALEGADFIKAVYEVDQSPIGRTPRSTPATYVGVFDEIRRLFSQTPEARLRGYSPGRFSFNSPQGRCPACEGAGTIKLEMNFLPPAFVRCETCQGCRFNLETLDIQYRDRNVAQVLEMSVEEALEFFASITRIRRPLEALRDTGLHYLKLGQISPTLSGGEAQRLKLVTHLLTGLKDAADLLNPLPRHNLFILEEPTIGLHMADVKRLVDVLQRLVDASHSVLVIEHNLDLVAEADWVIDLGPEAGDAGGEIVCQGTPEQVARNPHSHTGRFLRSVLA
jgi:excinuclease ABC subunit A